MADEADAKSPDPRTDAGNRVQKLWRRFERWLDGESGWPVVVRWVLAILLFGLAVLLLIFLSWLLRGAGLWGDLAFAIVVTTGVFFLARLSAQRWLKEKPRKAFLRAFSTTIFVLVGGPVAWVTRPVGIALLFLPILVWAGFRVAGRLWGRPAWMPVFWQAEVAGVLLLGIVLLIAPSVGSVVGEPDEVPAAAEVGGQDAAVAERFRPLMFFDSGEVRFPLDVEDAIDDGRMQMCRKAVRDDDDCETVREAGDIDQNLDYVEIAEAGGTPRGGDEGSAYYYHVVRENGHVYVDYWWFYSRNPSPVASKVFCGPGLRTPPFTCQEHVGDWEGLTVVLATCDEGEPDCEQVGDELLVPEEIRYGQHEHVVAYDWDEVLTQLWASLAPPSSPALAEAWEGLVLPAVRGAGVRPLAFVARNSHASYPRPCFRDCRQQTRDLPEAPHNGALPWAHNAAECDDCVKPLPLTGASESDPALWNAFPGRWGAQECILAGAYCDLSGAPRGPAFQGRYEEPGGDDVEQFCLRGASRLVRC
jgi:hypothetical protein